MFTVSGVRARTLSVVHVACWLTATEPVTTAWCGVPLGGGVVLPGVRVIVSVKLAAVYPLTITYTLLAVAGTVSWHDSFGPLRYGRHWYWLVVGAAPKRT